jgi:hypothetical protein
VVGELWLDRCHVVGVDEVSQSRRRTVGQVVLVAEVTQELGGELDGALGDVPVPRAGGRGREDEPEAVLAFAQQPLAGLGGLDQDGVRR